MSNIDLDNLNEEQKKAVLYNEGPLLILAGAAINLSIGDEGIFRIFNKTFAGALF